MSDRVWVPDTTFIVDNSGEKCRDRKCAKKPVARFRRGVVGRQGSGWWWCCEDHLYGRRLNNGVVEIQVAASSPAALRGYVS